jgi:hypothetical protein
MGNPDHPQIVFDVLDKNLSRLVISDQSCPQVERLLPYSACRELLQKGITVLLLVSGHSLPLLH